MLARLRIMLFDARRGALAPSPIGAIKGPQLETQRNQKYCFSPTNNRAIRCPSNVQQDSLFCDFSVLSVVFRY